MPEKNPPGTLRITLLILGGLAFLCFEWNLHRTQNASFLTAVFDMEVPPDGRQGVRGGPAGVSPGFCLAVASDPGVSLVIALFGPVSVVLGRRLGSLSSSAAALTTFLSPMLALGVFLMLPT
jgi:hypothetical protein